jgi:acyl-CoA dehydrogenase
VDRDIFEDAHRDFRAAVRDFLAKEAAPYADEWEEKGLIDRSFWTKAAQQNLVGFAAPERFGGLGLDDFRFNAVLDEEAVRVGCVVDKFTLANDIVMPYFTGLTTEEQQERWLPGIVSGEHVIAVAMTEPQAGSDLRGIAATAKRDGDHYLLSGSKTFVSNGIQAELVVVAARSDDEGGMSLLVVEEDMEGFARGRKLDKVGRRASDTAELFLDAVRVPVENLIGEPGRGLHHLKQNLAQERLSMAVTAVANAERALELTLEYVRTRNAFGQPVGSFQANRHALAELHTEVSVARVYVDRCILAHSRGELAAVDAAGAKYWTTELEFKTMDRCLQLHGGYGYMEEYEIARRWRDSRVQRIYGGTSEIMKEIVGRSLGL